MPLAIPWTAASLARRLSDRASTVSFKGFRSCTLVASASGLRRASTLQHLPSASPASVISAGYPGIIDYTNCQAVPPALSLQALDIPPTVALPPRVEHLLAASETLIAPLVSQTLDLPLVSSLLWFSQQPSTFCRCSPLTRPAVCRSLWASS